MSPFVARDFRLSVLLFGVLLAGVSPVTAREEQEKPSSSQTFLAQIDARFDAWDQDHDGALSVGELDAAVADPKVTGRAAAAVAALKRSSRNKNYRLPPLTKESIRERTGNSVNADQPDFARLYATMVSRLPKSNGTLFAPGVPKLDSIRQGRLGDCFCLAPLGAMLARNPKQVADLFEPQNDGTYKVRLGKEPICIAPPTDAEIVLSASTEQSGMWVNLYEKAVGASRLKPEEGKSTPAGGSALDAVARGGSAGTMLSLLTGNPITRFFLRFAKSADTTDAERTAKMTELRKQLAAAVKERRLMTCGTRKTTTPGITPNHAYAILHYEEATDTIRLWNPHGNSFTPKGAPGLTYGYPRSKGIFEMPLTHFIDQFSGMAFETPLPPATKPTE